MEEEEKWWSPTHLSEEEEVFEEKIPPNELPSENIESEKIDSIEEETSSVIEEVYTQQETPAQFEEKGFLGFSWLTKVEAIVFLVVLIIAVLNIGLGLVLMPDDPVYQENEAVVLASYAGYDIYEAENCDDYGCDYWTEIECWADIDLYHVVNSVNYTAESNGWLVIRVGNPSNSVERKSHRRQSKGHARRQFLQSLQFLQECKPHRLDCMEN